MALVHPDLSTLTSLRNKTILITGGSSGIDLATASLLSRLSPTNNLAILDLQPPSLFLQPPVSRVLFHRCDVTSWQNQRTGFAAATARFGRIDAAFVNAGIAEHQDQFFVDELDASGDLRAPDCRTLHIDLIAVAATVKLAIHYLRRSSEGGCIVLTSSLVGYLASAGAPLYSAAKHGIIGLMRALKQETAKLNIAVSVVAPAMTATPLIAQGRQAGKTVEEHVAELAGRRVPMNKPESVARAVCWLLEQGMRANGAGICIQADKFVDFERGLAKSRPAWMGDEMLGLFRGARDVPMFARLDAALVSKPKL